MNTTVKIILVIIGVLAVVGVIGLVGYTIGYKEANSAKTSPTPTATATVTAQKSVTRSAVASATATASSDSETDLISQALVDKLGMSEDTIKVTVSKIDGDYATGTVGSTESEVGGGYFVAVKQDGEWIIIADGNGTIDCATLDEYSVPATIISECYNSATEESVTR